MPRILRIGVAQIAPVLLDRAATLRKVVTAIGEAGRLGCRLVVFGEALVPGYPVWLARTGGARFDDAAQKGLHARYLEQAVEPEADHLHEVAAAARDATCAVVLGIVERARDRGGHSLYCSRVYLEPDGSIGSVHRKLVPTYEERLCWAPGDGAGLCVHALEGFRVGALNCWENWMPLARAALQAEGMDVHVALWPGNLRNTVDITRFLALEGRSYVVSVSGLLRAGDIPADFPLRDRLLADTGDVVCDGGSAVADPGGRWCLEPVTGREGVFAVDVDLGLVYAERQNFDLAGHYARPDVLRLRVDRQRPPPLDLA